MPTIIADSGPLVALINADDPHHAWAAHIVRPLPRPWIVAPAALIEATHILGNGPRALAALRRMLELLVVKDVAPDRVLALMESYAPVMDYADACAVLLAKAHKGAVVVTTDHRDFATYRIPFISPKGTFHTDPEE